MPRANASNAFAALMSDDSEEEEVIDADAVGTLAVVTTETAAEAQEQVDAEEDDEGTE